MTRIAAFVDESGDTSLSIGDGASERFVVCALIVEASARAQVEIAAEKIRRKHFQMGEMKSQGLKSPSRRERVVQELNELGATTFFLVVEKAKILQPGGLKFKKSFFKFFNRKLYDRLHTGFEHTDIVADEHGRQSFMGEFERYLFRELKLELFPEIEFRFAKSHEEILVQVADIYAGSMSKALAGEGSEGLLELLRERAVGISFWPGGLGPAPGFQLEGDKHNRFDALVREYSSRAAEGFVKRRAGDEEHATACAVLEYLVHEAGWGDDQFVSTARLLEYLTKTYRVEMHEQQFRSGVIAALRDEGVILASGPKGYKLPTTVNDIRSYVAQTSGVVVPMLHRLRRAREELMKASGKAFDPLDGELGLLRELVNAVGNAELSIVDEEGT